MFRWGYRGGGAGLEFGLIIWVIISVELIGRIVSIEVELGWV